MADSKISISISICMGSSCFARGNDKNLDFLEEIIKVNNLEVDLIGSRCENICSKGPTIKVNDVYHYAITKEAIIEILKKYYPSIKY